MILIVISIVLVLFLLSGIKIVNQTERGLVERFGKYSRFANPGFNWIIPIVDRIRYVNITEQMVDAQRQEVITSDNLNISVDAQVYFKVIEDQKGVWRSQYKVNNYRRQIVQLSRTTLRDLLGTMTLKDANSKRGDINKNLLTSLRKQTATWGIEIVRTELKEIQPPQDVQEAMNEVVKAENEKIAAKDLATATETQADGMKRAEIKVAEGRAKAVTLEADAKAKAIIVVNNAVEESFEGKAQLLRKLEATEKAIGTNAKIVLPHGESLVNVIGDMAGIKTLPIPKPKGQTKRN